MTGGGTDAKAWSIEEFMANHSFYQPGSELIRQRFSSRKYLNRPIAAEARERLSALLATLQRGPLGTPTRFTLAAATEEERAALRNLGTYGLIRNPTGFIIGVAQQADKGLEDFGYLMEIAVLSATDLGLGTCWLGGSFSRSGFAGKIEIRDDEVLPAVVSTGYSASPDGSGDLIRKGVGATSRLPWEDLFFEDRFGNPLAREAAGAHAPAVDGVREGPSASNKQPWRIIKQGDAWHFYLQRTPGYRNALLTRLMRVEDLQRVDMGIAMSHFEIMAAESDLRGRWTVAEPDIDKPDEDTEYTVTWINR